MLLVAPRRTANAARSCRSTVFAPSWSNIAEVLLASCAAVTFHGLTPRPRAAVEWLMNYRRLPSGPVLGNGTLRSHRHNHALRLLA
jgi:hypothetical protein